MQLDRPEAALLFAASKRKLKQQLWNPYFLGRRNKPEVFGPQGNKLGLHCYSRAHFRVDASLVSRGAQCGTLVPQQNSES